MMRFSLVALERDERAVLRALAESGAVQLARAPADGPDAAPLPPRNRAAQLARCASLLARVGELRRSLEITPRNHTPPEPGALTWELAGEKLRAAEQRAAGLLRRRQTLVQRWNQLGADCERMSGCRSLEIPLDPPDESSFLHFVTGTLPPETLARFQGDVAENVAVLLLPALDGRQPLVAMTTRRGRVALDDALQRSGFQPETLPATRGATTASLFQSCRRERDQVSATLEQLNAELRALARDCARPLADIEAFAQIEQRLSEAEQNFSRTEAAVLITGWVPAADAPAVEARLRQITASRCVIETAKPDNGSEEQTPVLLRHPRWLRPFEMLVSAYGLPKYQELEPTLFVALSYVLMFGMMFGDAGHGAVLAAGGLAAMVLGRTAKWRDAGLLLVFAALSSIAFGLAYGSCFGLAPFKKYALWRDPLEGDPMALMRGAIGIGVVMISLGLILNVINRFRRGDVIGGLLDKFGLVGVLFYWGALALVVKFAAIESRGLVAAAIAVFLGVPVAGWALKEPIEYFARRRAGHGHEFDGGFFGALTESLVGAFEAALSYLANTISFVRLAAYAMSHAALLVAAFMMAEQVRHLSVAGGVFSVSIVVAGNLVAIVLEGLVASVQALRLEYYEFFGKFFSGDGAAFTPFRLATGGEGST